MGLRGLLISIANLLSLVLFALSWFYDGCPETSDQKETSREKGVEDLTQEEHGNVDLAVGGLPNEDIGVSNPDSLTEATDPPTDRTGLDQTLEHEDPDLTVEGLPNEDIGVSNSDSLIEATHPPTESTELDKTLVHKDSIFTVPSPPTIDANAFNAFKRRHWVCPTLRPWKWVDWLKLMRQRQLIPGRPRNTFIVASETDLRSIFTNYVGSNIFKSVSSLRIVDFARVDSLEKFAAYEGEAYIEVAMKKYLPIHFHCIRTLSKVYDVYMISDNGKFERKRKSSLEYFSSRCIPQEDRVQDGNIYWNPIFRPLAIA